MNSAEKRSRHWLLLRQKGIATVEMALIFPLIAMMAFGIIDFGRLIQARLIVTNLAREGGSLASRDVQSTPSLVTMLQQGGTPLNMVAGGKIYIWKIRAGTSAANPEPFIDMTSSASGGALGVGSSIGSGQTNLGLTPALFHHLEFDRAHQSSDIGDVTVVEVYYNYIPITPFSQIITLFFPGSAAILPDTGQIISSRAVF